jgi:hypothetical protein
MASPRGTDELDAMLILQRLQVTLGSACRYSEPPYYIGRLQLVPFRQSLQNPCATVPCGAIWGIGVIASKHIRVIGVIATGGIRVIGVIAFAVFVPNRRGLLRAAISDADEICETITRPATEDHILASALELCLVM